MIPENLIFVHCFIQAARKLDRVNCSANFTGCVFITLVYCSKTPKRIELVLDVRDTTEESYFLLDGVLIRRRIERLFQRWNVGFRKFSDLATPRLGCLGALVRLLLTMQSVLYTFIELRRAFSCS